MKSYDYDELRAAVEAVQYWLQSREAGPVEGHAFVAIELLADYTEAMLDLSDEGHHP